MSRTAAKKRPSLLGNYVFMEKTLNALEIGMKTRKNLILYGPGGHGKSEYTAEFFYEKNIMPFTQTMGSGMTTDRLFGGFDVKKYAETGKIEYLVENSFMNFEYVIFEELLDGPDYILEQLKDILSSGEFRNGTQVFKIKTKFIVGCTNKTRKEFSKNSSLKALMERFPLEHNVVWDNYTEASYTALLSKNFLQGVDPIIPFILQEYTRNSILISPRIALDAYEIFEGCGPDSLIYIAEFAEKPTLINEALARFQESLKFKQLGMEIEDIVKALESSPANNTPELQASFVDNFKLLNQKFAEVRAMSVTEDMVQSHTGIKLMAEAAMKNMQDRYTLAVKNLRGENLAPEMEPKKKKRKNPYFDEKYVGVETNDEF